MHKSGNLFVLVRISFLFLMGMAQAAQGGGPACLLRQSGLNFQVVRAEKTDEQIHFYQLKKAGAADGKPLKPYLIQGDLVATDDLDDLTEYGKKQMPAFVCAEYRNAGGKMVRGWMPSKNLLQVLNVNSPGASEKTAPEVRVLLGSLSDPTGLKPGSLLRWRTGQTTTETPPFTVKLNPPAKSGQAVVQFGEKKLELSGRKGTLKDMPAELTECPIDFQLFRNALLLVATAGCWGNHGDSDPTGAYFNK